MSRKGKSVLRTGSSGDPRACFVWTGYPASLARSCSPKVLTFAFVSPLVFVGSLGAHVQTQPIGENLGRISAAHTVIFLGAIALQTVFMAGDTLAQVRIKVLGTGGTASVLVQEEVGHAL